MSRSMGVSLRLANRYGKTKRDVTARPALQKSDVKS